MTPFSNKGPILHRDSISFHLSHQPPLSVMCHFLCSKSDTFPPKSYIFITWKWHMPDRGGWWLKWKLIFITMKNWALIRKVVLYAKDATRAPCIGAFKMSSVPSFPWSWLLTVKLCLGDITSKFWKIVCEGEKVRTRGCISASAWYKLSFEPSTNSVRFVLFLYYKYM